MKDATTTRETRADRLGASRITSALELLEAAGVVVSEVWRGRFSARLELPGVGELEINGGRLALHAGGESVEIAPDLRLRTVALRLRVLQAAAASRGAVVAGEVA